MSVKINVKLLGLTTWGARVPPFLWAIKMATETSRHFPHAFPQWACQSLRLSSTNISNSVFFCNYNGTIPGQF